MRNFNWDFKENMTREEFQEILKQHRAFLNVDKLLKEVEELTGSLETANEKLAPILKKEREDKLLALLPKTAKKDLASDIIALANISDEMDDDAIKAALKDTVANRAYLQEAPVSTTEPKEESSSLFGNKQTKEEVAKSTIFD